MSLLQMQGIEKSFNTVKVLYGIDFVLQKGSVHALMGENGAGKSTLMKGLAGVHKFDKGSISIHGKETTIANPKHARELGISMIHQEIALVPEMTVAENIFMGREPIKKGFVDYTKMYEDTLALFHTMKIPVNPRAKVGSLRVADQQLIEIAKAISLNAEIIIMDEPTSAITDKEVENLFAIIEDLKKQGKGIIYISHKMDEIFRISDDITIMRDGHYVDTWKASEINQNTLIKNMVGRELTEIYPKTIVPISDNVLELKEFTHGRHFQDVNISLRRGEILGIAGLVGAGRTELMHALFGMAKPEHGEIIYEGKPLKVKKPKQAIKAGFAYLTEDRKNEGLVLNMSVGQNITLSSMKSLTQGLFIQKRRENRIIRSQIEALRIKTRSGAQLVKSLSGGNQQKVALAKWLILEPKIMILDEPTRGIDVGAKAEIYKLMCDFVSKGNSIIMISSEMSEVMGMSDRIVVLSNGKVGGELSREEFAQEKIMEMAVAHL